MFPALLEARRWFFINIKYLVKQVKPHLCSLQSPKFNQQMNPYTEQMDLDLENLVQV